MPGAPTDQARQMMAAAVKPRRPGETQRPETPAVPRNIKDRPLAISPMVNVKGDRPPEFEGEEW